MIHKVTPKQLNFIVKMFKLFQFLQIIFFVVGIKQIVDSKKNRKQVDHERNLSCQKGYIFVTTVLKKSCIINRVEAKNIMSSTKNKSDLNNISASRLRPEPNPKVNTEQASCSNITKFQLIVLHIYPYEDVLWGTEG